MTSPKRAPWLVFLLLLAMAGVALLCLCCRSPVTPAPVVWESSHREPTLEERRKHCESMGQEFATGYVYELDLSRKDGAPERVATVPGHIRLADGLVVFEDAMVLGGYQGLIWFGPDRVARFLPAPEDSYTLKLLPFDMDGDDDLDVIAMQEYSVVNEAENTSTSFARAVVWLQDGDALRRTRALSTAGYAGFHEMVLLDIEGSAAAEMVFRDARELKVLRAQPGGKEVRASLAPLPLNIQHLATETGDVNGDGLRDLLVLGARTDGVEQNSVRVIFAKAGGGYGASVDSALDAFFGRVSGFADFSGDGVPDLALTRVDRTKNLFVVDLWLGHADGSFSAPRRVAEGLPQEPDLSPFDLDGDGAHELVMWSDKLTIASLRGGQPSVLFERDKVPYSQRGTMIKRSTRTDDVSVYWVVPGCDGTWVH